jgi:hypothetical protein
MANTFTQCFFLATNLNVELVLGYTGGGRSHSFTLD